MSPAEERRHVLITWMRERPEHSGLTTQQIVDVSGIYEGNGRADKCHADLIVLALRGVVERWGSRPSTWDVVA